MSSRNRGNRKVLLRLWQADSHCFYCGCLTEMPLSGVNFKSPPPNNTATRDHVFSRFDPRRHDPDNPHRGKMVLCCYGCNQKRNDVEQRRVPIKLRTALTRKRIRFFEGFEPFYPIKHDLTNIKMADIVLA